MNKSPSVSIIERDMSTYSVTNSATSIAIIGFATKGPIDTPTTVTSLKEFRELFGYAPSLISHSYLAVVKAFNQTNKVIFTRVADETAVASQRVINNISSLVPGYTTLAKYTDVSPTHDGYLAGELYGISVNARQMLISAKASGGWAIDNIVSKLTSAMAATYGFQEFTARSFTATTTKPYCFKLSLDADATPFGTAHENFIIDVGNADTLSTISTKINSQIVNGTRTYATSVIATATLTTFVSSGSLPTDGVFSVTINGRTKEYTIASKPTDSIASLATVMNAACEAATLANEADRIGVTYNATQIIFYSKSSNVGDMSAISGTLIAYGGTDLFGTPSYVASGVGITNGLAAVYSEVHVDTGRLRITSGTLGAASKIEIAIPDTALETNSLITLLTSTQTAIDGQDALTGVAVSRDTTTRKIKFTTTTTTTAHPTVVTYGTNSLLTLLGGITDVDGVAAVAAIDSDKVIIESLEKGSATSLISVIKYTETDPLTTDETVTVEVYYDSIQKETFSGMSLVIGEDNFIETIINAEPESGGSSWINIDTTDTDDDGEILFPDGTYNVGAISDDVDEGDEQAYDESHYDIGTYDYKVGTDGVPQIGGEEFFIAALATTSDLANDELNDFHILTTPDNTTQAVQTAAIALAEFRGDFMYIVDPAFGLTYSEARDWHNGLGDNGRTAAVNSSYAAVYWPWLKEYDTDNSKYVWCPPSVFIGEKYLEIDRVYNPWYAPAGDARGRLVAQDIETSPSFAQREELYGSLNCVNPIVKFNAQGIEVYGQKTALRQLVASNRVNVKRMLIYIKKLVKRALNSMIFEPNNPDSWQTATNLITSILEPIRQDSGLEQYKVVIDATINTPDIIAQNQMKGVIKLVPTNTIEMIEMNINVYKTGTSIS